MFWKSKYLAQALKQRIIIIIRNFKIRNICLRDFFY